MPLEGASRGCGMKSFRFALIGGAVLAALAAGAAPAVAFDGFGKDIPLEAAARQIVPQGWTVDFGEGVDRNAKISWSGAKDWKTALSNAVASRGYVAQFGSSSVVIAKGGRVAQAPDSPKTSRRPAKESKESVSARPAPRRAPNADAESAVREIGGGGFVIKPYRQAKPAEEPKSAETSIVAKDSSGGEDTAWRPYAGKVTKDASVSSAPVRFSVAEGDELRSVLEKWGSAAGWTVKWDSQFHYPIEASATFDGDFIEAVSALVRAMSEARPVITVDFYKGNKVVVVKNEAADEVN